MQLIEFRVTKDTFGWPHPFIPNGTTVILLQKSNARVMRYEAPQPPDDPFPKLDPAANAVDLGPEALRLVLAQFPDAQSSEKDQVFTCPDELAVKAAW
ncbi:MAG: hypothetical protein U0232_11690 [Thermomicrobiales bacterium]